MVEYTTTDNFCTGKQGCNLSIPSKIQDASHSNLNIMFIMLAKIKIFLKLFSTDLLCVECNDILKSDGSIQYFEKWNENADYIRQYGSSSSD